MYHRKKWAMAVVSAISLVLVLSGCGKGSDASDQSVEASKTPAAPVKIEMMKIGWGTKPPTDDFIKSPLDQKLNIDLKLSLAASVDDFKNQLNTRIAAGDFPDIIELDSRATLQQLSDKGVLLDLAPYLDKLGETVKFVGEEGLKKGVINGKTYAIPKTPNIITHSYYIRKDWLDKVGLGMPTTSDELLQVAKAFTENDPDGNGKKTPMELQVTIGRHLVPFSGHTAYP
ncbi:MAG: family 1 extracellular solute-binding protein [Paenibacillaceae bacterium]|nr:family 1 extracellular solute-binding protein [Paenibacillaceae bacterium]